MNISFGVRVAAAAALAGLCACGGGGSGVDAGQSAGTQSAPVPPIADLTGTWNVAESGVSNCANLATYALDPYRLIITQSGNALTIVAPAGTFAGNIDGDKVAWSGSYPSGSGRTTITSMALTAAASGNAISGSAGWTWTDGAASCSGMSQSINATRVPEAVPVPPAPSGLSASAQSASSVGLVWNDNSNNESGFKVERRRADDAASAFAQITLLAADTTSFLDTGLDAATAYDYRVRAFNGAGDSPYSNVFTVTTLAPPPPAPNPPSGLALTVNSSSSITLRWTDNSTNETAFRLERSTGNDGGFSEMATVAADTTSYRDTGLAPATHYFYRVRAANATGSSAYSNTANATTSPAAVAPAAPRSLSATASSVSLRIDLRWTDNSTNETGFRIERSTNANNGFTQIATTAAGVTTYSDSAGLERNTKYYYRVRATDATTGLNSAYSNTDSATTVRRELVSD